MSQPPDPSPPPTGYSTRHLANVFAAVRSGAAPERVGAYHIRELIAEGGMGSVYKAEQLEPLQRLVAVKIIKLGMDTRQVIARFNAERQTLAMMNHPNVAKVIDAGATETGRPYFVMEYVEGEPITTFADRHKLSLAERLKLLSQACAAVQHAHQKAIIHRDLKPSNILVTLTDDQPVVKVIDFGVSKAIAQRDTERTMFTEIGQFVGTPEYMAPEQAEAIEADVDTRCDVYSLGVVLYELISGTLPFDAQTLRSGGYREIQRIIREVDPPRPSTRLSAMAGGGAAVAALRRTPLETLARQLRGELDWIPLKAMRKERSARYATAAELAEDIENYLADRPLRAGPETAVYRARKFLRRNTGAVAAVAAILLLLLGGIVATTWQAVRATRAERQAVMQRQEADRQRAVAETASASEREINHFLTEDLLASAAPEVTRGRELSVREAVDRAAAAVGTRFADKPLVEAAVRAVLADVYNSLGQDAVALTHAKIAMDLTAAHAGANSALALEAKHEYARILSVTGDDAAAEVLLRDVLARSRQLFGEDDRITIAAMNTLGLALRRQGRLIDAEKFDRQVLAATERLSGPDSSSAAQALNSLAVGLAELNRDDQAEPLYRRALEIREKRLGKDHPSYISTLSNLARLIDRRGRTAEAEAMYREVLAEQRRIRGDDHPSTMLAIQNLGVSLGIQGKYDEAEALDREALERRMRVLGPDHFETLQTQSNLGALLVMRGRFAEAEPLLRAAVDGRRRVLGPDHFNTLSSTLSLVSALYNQGKLQPSVELLDEVCENPSFGKFPAVKQALAVARRGICLAKLNRPDRATPILLDAHARLITTQQGDSTSMRETLAALVAVSQARGQTADELKWSAELAALPRDTPPTTQPHK